MFLHISSFAFNNLTIDLFGLKNNLVPGVCPTKGSPAACSVLGQDRQEDWSGYWKASSPSWRHYLTRCKNFGSKAGAKTEWKTKKKNKKNMKITFLTTSDDKLLKGKRMDKIEIHEKGNCKHAFVSGMCSKHTHPPTATHWNRSDGKPASESKLSLRSCSWLVTFSLLAQLAQTVSSATFRLWAKAQHNLQMPHFERNQ